MKRTFSLFISLMLLMGCIGTAYAEDLLDDYTQAEKMERQIALGSGLRGALKVAVTGEESLAAMLSPLNDAEFQMRLIRTTDKLDAQIYAVKEEKETAQTEIFMDTNAWYLKTQLLLGSMLSLANRGDLISSLTASMTQGNPTYYSFLLGLLLQGEGVERTDDALVSQVRAWLDGYAGEPEVFSETDGTRMRFSYTISTKDIKEELKAIVRMAREDETFYDVLSALMTQRQANLALAESYSWYVESVIDALPLHDMLRCTRTVTMQGEEVETQLEVPVYDAKERWDSISLVSTPEQVTYVLSGSAGELKWIPDAQTDAHLSGDIAYSPKNEKSVAFRYDILSQTETSVDAEDYHHETYTYTIRIHAAQTEDTEEAVTFEPIEVQLRLHYYSKSAKRSATTLDVTLAGLIPGGRIQAAAKLRTTTPWEISEMNTADAIDLSEQDTSELLRIAQDIGANLLATLDTIKETSVEAPASSEPTEESENTDAADESVQDASEATAEEKEDVVAVSDTDEVTEETDTGSAADAQDIPEESQDGEDTEVPAELTEEEGMQVEETLQDTETETTDESVQSAETEKPAAVIEIKRNTQTEEAQ